MWDPSWTGVEPVVPVKSSTPGIYPVPKLMVFWDLVMGITPGVPPDPGGAIQVRGAAQGADQVTVNAEEDDQGTNESGGDN